MDSIIASPDLFGWFVERMLDARHEREKHDVLAEENPFGTMYVAGLLLHMQSLSWIVQLDQTGPRLDMDVADHSGKELPPRERLETYKSAADRYLLYLGLWDGLQGHQQGRYYQITENNLADRARHYYGVAAHLAERLPPPVSHNGPVFSEMSAHFGTYLAILLTMRGSILHLLPKVTPGEEFHLARGTT